MSRPVPRSLALIPLTLATILFVVSCLGDPSGPRTVPGQLAVVPSFVSPAASLVEISQVRAILTRVDDGSEALDTIVSADPQNNVVDLTLRVVIFPPSEDFILTLECRNPAGEVVFRGGPVAVTATTRTDDEGVEQEVVIDYVGVGSDAAVIHILDPVSAVNFGDTIQLNVEVLDSSDLAMPETPVAWTSLNTLRASVTSPEYPVALVAGESERGPVEIEASTLTGQADTVTITVEAIPNAIAIVSGDGQSGFANSRLNEPLSVVVTAADDLGVADAAVEFTTAEGGSFDRQSVLTDAAGQASTTWTLGPTAGTQTATASIAGVGSVTFAATVQGGVAWINAAGGSWSSGSNWSTGTPPAAADVAVIALDGDYTVSLDVAATIAGLALGGTNGTQRLTIDAYDLTLNGPGTVGSNGIVEMTASTLAGTGNLTVDGMFDWQGGTISGTGRVDVNSSGGLTLGGGTKYLQNQRVLSNSGTGTWSTGDILAGNGSLMRIEEGGTLDIQGDVTLAQDLGSPSSFVNAGTVTRSSGTGTTTFTNEFNNIGTLDVRSGTVSLGGSSTTLTDTVYVALGAVLDLAGSGQTLGTELYVSDTSSTLAPGTLRISGSVQTTGNDTIATGIDVTGSLDVAGGSLVLTGTSVIGSFSGAVSIAPTAQLEFYQTSGHTFTGTSSVTGQGTLRARNSSVTVNGSYSVGMTDIDADFIGGMLSFSGGDTATTADLVVRDGGARGGAGVLAVTDTFDFQTGDLDGSGITRVAPGGTLTFSTNMIKALSNGHTLENAGIVVALDGGLRPRGNALIDNQAGAVFDIKTDAFSISFENTGNRISNTGTFRKSIGTGTSSIVASVPFTNANGGVVDVQTGTLSIGNFTHAAGAAIQGSGTLALGTVVSFEGDVNPGTSPGILNMTGDVPQGRQSTFNIDLDGAAVGSGYDQLNVSGAVVLDGDLNIRSGFVPTVGATFTVLTYGSRTGSFANITGLDVGGGVTLQPQWNANSLDLVATAGPPPQILFASDSGGALSVGVYTTDDTGPNTARVYPLPNLGNERLFPRWSPDRTRIAYSFGEWPNPNALVVMSATGDTSQTVVNDTSTFYPKWSPNGQHLGFICGNGFSEIDVCVISDVTGAISSLPLNNYIVVTDNTPAAWQQGPVSAAWDPLNSDRVVFARDSSDGVNPPTSRFFTASYTGANVQPLHTSILDVGNGPLQVFGTMDWSPDGSMLAFAASDPQGSYRIYVMGSDGTGLRQLTFLSGFDDGPLFSPDGSEILFGRDENCSYNGWIVDIDNTDGSLERQITDDNICDFDTYLLTGDWSPDGSQIVLVGFDQTTGWTHIYVVPRDVTAATYRTVRVRVGRDADLGSWLREIQPSWRP